LVITFGVLQQVFPVFFLFFGGGLSRHVVYVVVVILGDDVVHTTLVRVVERTVRFVFARKRQGRRGFRCGSLLLRFALTTSFGRPSGESRGPPMGDASSGVTIVVRIDEIVVVVRTNTTTTIGRVVAIRHWLTR
jgi:hypothetical protein